jgi:hypothetical protein
MLQKLLYLFKDLVLLRWFLNYTSVRKTNLAYKDHGNYFRICIRKTYFLEKLLGRYQPFNVSYLLACRPMKVLLFENNSLQTTDCLSPRLLGRVITEILVTSAPREPWTRDVKPYETSNLTSLWQPLCLWYLL